jgi:two-component system sensor kinase FixL
VRNDEESTYLSDAKTSWVGSEAILNRLMEIARISALSEMASGIAHELNQPLGAIATFSQAGERLLNRPESMVARALDVFRQINSEALAAGEGIRRIRSLFNQADLERTPSQIPVLLEELRPVLEVIAAGAQVQLQVEVESPSPHVLVDKLRIQHVIFALVQNALDACKTAERAATVAIDVRSDRYAAELSVTDSGRGIPNEIREQIFRPFFTTKPQGTGLGLASCRAIVETHEGTIGFDRPSVGGCRFWVRLPVMQG